MCLITGQFELNNVGWNSSLLREHLPGGYESKEMLSSKGVSLTGDRYLHGNNSDEFNSFVQ